MIGRYVAVNRMNHLLIKPLSSFIAVTGRRRVGKTYLVDEMYAQHMCLRVTGIQDVDTETQIANFVQKISEYSGKKIAKPPATWQDVMILLKQYLQSLSKRRKQVIFIDELPWIATARSGFIQLLAHLWNDFLSKEKHFILVICGSATSWITKKIINDRGGFHNRVTDRIQLEPFTLAETKEFLQSKKLKFTDQAIAELYMIMGGIPFYLEQIRKGESVQQTVGRLCFSKDGILRNEYNNLYKALFDYPENHEAIVLALAKSVGGLTRSEIIKKSKVKAGGPYNRAMEDLIVSGFVEEIIPYGRIKRGAKYRLLDEYSIFYHRFIHRNKNKGESVWSTLAQTQSYKIWTGYAFENLCLKHIQQIKIILGIANVHTEHYSYARKGEASKKGYQIDMVIDRKDQIVNLCECKHYGDTFTINKAYAQKLRSRRMAFSEDTKTRKSVYNTMITNYGLEKNEYALEVIDSDITVSDIIKTRINNG